MQEVLKSAPVVPVVVIDDAEIAVPVAQALVDGGLPVIEVTLRTEAATDAVASIAEQVPSAYVGAGTVLNAEQAQIIVDAGARFIVSPGLHEPVVEKAKALGVPLIPGVATASETQLAWNLGLHVLKFFPAEQAGGLAMIKALSAAFRDIQFMPTGGVSPKNLREYLASPAVLACGGSWLTPANVLAERNYQQIRDLATEAVAIAKEARG